jgi:hypothetical protein
MHIFISEAVLQERLRSKLGEKEAADETKSLRNAQQRGGPRREGFDAKTYKAYLDLANPSKRFSPERSPGPARGLQQPRGWHTRFGCTTARKAAQFGRQTVRSGHALACRVNAGISDLLHRCWGPPPAPSALRRQPTEQPTLQRPNPSVRGTHGATNRLMNTLNPANENRYSPGFEGGRRSSERSKPLSWSFPRDLPLRCYIWHPKRGKPCMRQRDSEHARVPEKSRNLPSQKLGDERPLVRILESATTNQKRQIHV